MTITTEFCIEIDPLTGQPDGHPFMVSNILEAYGYIPDNFAPFNRIPYTDPGQIGVYQIYTSVYTLNTETNVWEDSWTVVEMTDEQRADKQQREKIRWTNLPCADNFTAWTFDESTCRFVPPIPRITDTPPDGQEYLWDGPTNNWRLAPLVPKDGKQYTWSFAQWAWLEV